jgi:hypothetical protein
MGLLTGEGATGRTIYVYDSLNRLIRATYDKTTFAFTYDKTGNRLKKRVILTKPSGTVDFDADAKTDVAIYQTSTGNWYIIPSSGGAPYGVGWGGDLSDKPAPGDYDGDGKTDIAVYRVSTGIWWINPSTGTPYTVGWGGGASDIPVIANPASIY